MADQEPIHLEPRVAKLEVGLDRLTEDVRSLAGIVRDQGSNIEKQLQGLTVAVTQAQGPRKTDWGIVIAAVGLMLAIGSAAFWPLNQKTDYTMTSLQTVAAELKTHEQLQLHPVGQALVQRLEEQLAAHIALNERELKEHDESDTKMFDELDKKLQTEYQLVNMTINTKIENMDTKYALELKSLDDQIQKRFGKLEALRVWQQQQDELELREWRNKQMGF